MLSAESLKQIDTELAKYPADRRRSAIMGALRIAQTEKGWLAPETIEFVAEYIGITPVQAYYYRRLGLPLSDAMPMLLCSLRFWRASVVFLRSWPLPC